MNSFCNTVFVIVMQIKLVVVVVVVVVGTSVKKGPIREVICGIKQDDLNS